MLSKLQLEVARELQRGAKVRVSKSDFYFVYVGERSLRSDTLEALVKCGILKIPGYSDVTTELKVEVDVQALERVLSGLDEVERIQAELDALKLRMHRLKEKKRAKAGV